MLGKIMCSWDNQITFDSQEIYNIFVTELVQVNENEYVALKGYYVCGENAHVIVNLTVPAEVPGGATIYLFEMLENISG